MQQNTMFIFDSVIMQQAYITEFSLKKLATMSQILYRIYLNNKTTTQLLFLFVVVVVVVVALFHNIADLW